MPHIDLTLSGTRDALLGKEAVGIVHRLTAEILGKAPELMATTVRYVHEQDWFIAGQSLLETGGSAFHLDISITDETNTKAQKARFIQAVYDALAHLRPNPALCSYVHLIDARAAAYGYGGRTQEWRHQHG